MSETKLLETAYTVIQDPKHWTQGQISADARGRNISPSDEKAEKWCSLGALLKAAYILGLYKVEEEVRKQVFHRAEAILNICAGREYVGYNDEHTHEEVMRLWLKAIHRAKSTTSCEH